MMDMIPKTAQDLIRAVMTVQGSDQGEQSAVDFSRVLARHVEPGGNRNSEAEGRVPEQAAQKPESRDNDSIRSDGDPKAEYAEGSSGKNGSEKFKNEEGRVSSTPLDGGMTSVLSWTAGMEGALSGLEPGMPSTLSQSGPVTPAVTTVGLSSNLAGEIAARYSDHGGVQTLTLRLDPAHLGKVDVTMVAKGDHLTVTLEAGNREAETALRDNLKDLTDAIGAKTGRFNQVEVKVQVKADSGSGRGDDPENPERQENRQDRRDDPNQQESRPDEQRSDQAVSDPTESGSGRQGG